MISIKNFQKKYKDKLLFTGVNFQIKDNKVTFLMGPNGAGKTTLLKCIMGLEEYSGEICDSENGKYLKSREAYLTIWDNCPFYNTVSGLHNLYIFSETKKNRKEIVEIAGKYLPYDILKRKVSTYSYGQKKKLALALVDILEPKVLIMDEISNGLDYEMMIELKKDVIRFAEENTVILTGHQFGFYNDIVDDLVVIKDKNLKLIDDSFKTSDMTLEEIYEEELCDR